MSFQRHNTPIKKFIRKCKYQELREAGIESRKAAIFRDWTLNKVRLIAEGIADPIR